MQSEDLDPAIFFMLSENIFDNMTIVNGVLQPTGSCTLYVTSPNCVSSPYLFCVSLCHIVCLYHQPRFRTWSSSDPSAEGCRLCVADAGHLTSVSQCAECRTILVTTLRLRLMVLPFLLNRPPTLPLVVPPTCLPPPPIGSQDPAVVLDGATHVSGPKLPCNYVQQMPVL